MATADAAADLKAAAPARRFPWSCPCIRCGEYAVRMGLWEPEGDEFSCVSCEAEFSEEDVRNLLNGWAGFLAALDAARAAAK